MFRMALCWLTSRILKGLADLRLMFREPNSRACVRGATSPSSINLTSAVMDGTLPTSARTPLRRGLETVFKCKRKHVYVRTCWQPILFCFIKMSGEFFSVNSHDWSSCIYFKNDRKTYYGKQCLWEFTNVRIKFFNSLNLVFLLSLLHR